MTRVLVVDDSAVIRRVLTSALLREADLEVATAVDPYDAREKVVQFEPDVITLDLEMPRMDGLSFLERLMRYHPLPVVVVSSLAPSRSDAAVRALQLGAVAVIAKPQSAAGLAELAGQLLAAIRMASQIDPAALAAPATAPVAARAAVAAPAPEAGQRVIAIGASTGGPQAIERLVTTLPAQAPGVLIVQHMPAGFTAAFARRLDARSTLDVREAEDGEPLTNGTARIAPGGRHMVLERGRDGYVIGVREGPQVHYQRPSVDVLFHSVAHAAGADAVGVLLTGMGSDGASGMLALRDAGAHTIAQDETTSVVFSMPREADRFGAVCEMLPLPRIADGVLAALEHRRGAVRPSPASRP